MPKTIGSDQLPALDARMTLARVALSRNELLLLADAHFSGFIVELSEHCEQSKLFSELGQDVTGQYLNFVDMLLRLHGVATESGQPRSHGE